MATFIPTVKNFLGQTFKSVRLMFTSTKGTTRASLAGKWQRIGERATYPLMIVSGGALVLWGWQQITGTAQKTADGIAERLDEAGNTLDNYAMYSLIAVAALAGLYIVTRRR